MPNRLIREGFLDSEAINSLGDAAECFFHRLMLAADDAGRMDGRVEILRARLFPLDTSRRASDVEKTLAACVKQGLVIPYEWKGQRFLQVSKWQRCSPCVTSKYPWRDGSFRIDYRKVETRDGEKDFAATSIANAIPSARDSYGIGVVIPPMYGDVDVFVDEGVDDAPAPKRSKSKSGTLLADWIAALPEGEAAIPADGAVFEYAAKIGLPPEYIALAWSWFKSEMAERETRQANWRGHFFNAVKGNWPKYWFADDAGGWGLTTKGKQAQRAAQ